jgi:hypothetical protein
MTVPIAGANPGSAHLLHNEHSAQGEDPMNWFERVHQGRTVEHWFFSFEVLRVCWVNMNMPFLCLRTVGRSR